MRFYVQIDRVMWKFQSRAQVILYSKLSQRPLRIHSDGVIYMNEEEEDDRGESRTVVYIVEFNF